MLLRIVTAVLLVALLAGPTWVLAPRAHACSCGGSSVEQRVLAPELVVLGTVRSIVQVDDSFQYDLPITVYDLAITVDEYLKGDGPPAITVRDYASLQGTACSAFSPDAVGERHLLFLGRDDAGPLTTSICVGSTVINDRNRAHVDDVIAEIRQIVSGEATTPVADATPTTVATAGELPDGGARDVADGAGRALVWPLVLGGAAALVAGGGLGLRLRR